VRKKKQLLLGVGVGLLVRPVIARVARPLTSKARQAVRVKLYELACQYMQDFDADRPPPH
jgi:hypothetical protein